nr:hypothetical protein KitaXyl93_57040 [Kitasatospora sp. Xyl93]
MNRRVQPPALQQLLGCLGWAIGVPFPYTVAQTAAHDTGTPRSTCRGQGRLTGAVGPAVRCRARLPA